MKLRQRRTGVREGWFVPAELVWMRLQKYLDLGWFHLSPPKQLRGTRSFKGAFQQLHCFNVCNTSEAPRGRSLTKTSSIDTLKHLT